MRIGLVAPPWERVPPVGYGGTEAVVATLAEQLVARGHEVRVFTVGSSSVAVPTSAIFEDPPLPMGHASFEAAHAVAAYEELADMDVIHDHTVVGPALGLAHRHRGAVVATVHSPLTSPLRRLYREIGEHVSLVAISHRQAETAPEVRVTAVVHHGLDLDQFPTGPGDGGYALFLGRMCAEKGVVTAARAARQAGTRLLIAAKSRDSEEQAYLEKHVMPELGGCVTYLGEVDVEQRLGLLQHARVLLNPIAWEEPFGLVMTEALACGTPVVGCPRGAAPEIVDQGRTGFLAETEDELAAALRRVDELDRDDCRAACEARFSGARMAEAYEEVYREAVARNRRRLLRRDALRRSSSSNGVHA